MVVLSGGQDSTTCLYWAKSKFERVEALTFDYGQRHRSEIGAASHIAAEANVPWRVIDLTGFGKVSKSALTDKAVEVAADGGMNGLPSTFTPGRNLVFLAVAASAAVALGIRSLVTGVCQTDYSGYPDCRLTTIEAMEVAIRLGMDLGLQFEIHTPLMHLTKKETVELAMNLGPQSWKALGDTITCYHGQRPGCGACPACELRAKGFAEAGHADPAY
jgi:7-cyano-7-deazaguanine synthase